MPSDHATATNVQKTDIEDLSDVTCSVEYTSDTTTFSTNKFVHVDCALGGNFEITSDGVITLSGTPVTKTCTIGNNLLDSSGNTPSPPTTLHMELLCDMYHHTGARPIPDTIRSTFTAASIETFRSTLYGAIKHALESYIESRFFKDVSTNTFAPTIEAAIDGTTINYGNDNTHTGFKYTGGTADPDGTEHGHMFLINMLNTRNQSALISNISSPTGPVATATFLSDASHMVMGLKVTTTGGFTNVHTNYAVGVKFS
jgi:hypothetical protein